MAKQTERRSTGRRPGLKEGQDGDYKDLNQLRRFISEKGKIRSRRITGACRRHQVQIAIAVKRAREMALLPYVGER
jgi:ribosomal protein S18